MGAATGGVVDLWEGLLPHGLPGVGRRASAVRQRRGGRSVEPRLHIHRRVAALSVDGSGREGFHWPTFLGRTRLKTWKQKKIPRAWRMLLGTGFTVFFPRIEIFRRRFEVLACVT